MPTPLASPDDVADVWRPLTADETMRVANLIQKASSQLRQRMPSLDARVARLQADPTDVGGLDPVVVATVVATVVKKFLSNVDGRVSESLGSASVAYALRGDKDSIRGELRVTDIDIQPLLAPRVKPRLGSFKVRPTMSPWPYGDIAGPTISDLIGIGEPGVPYRDPSS